MVKKLYDFKDVVVLRETPRAVCILSPLDNKTEVWLPLSQVEIDYTEPHLADVTIPDWLADEKDLL